MGVNIYSLKVKTAAIFAVLFLALLAFLVFYLEPLNRMGFIEEAKSSLAEHAGQIASDLDFTFRRAIAELEAIAKLPDVVSMDKERLDRTLTEVNVITQFFNTYFVLDRTGRWVSLPPNPERVGQRIPEENMGWVEETFREDRTVFLDVVKTLAGTLSSGFSTPIRDASGGQVGLLRGVIVTTRDNAVLSSIEKTMVGDNGYAYMVSADGWLIAHPRMDLSVEDFKLYDYKGYEPVQGCISGKSGVTTYNYEGASWVAAYHPIESTGWCVVVQRLEDDIIEHASTATGAFKASVAVMAVLTTTVFIFFITIALRPLFIIVEDIKARRFSYEGLFSRDEIGIIAKEFRSLYSDLSKSEEELRVHRDRLEELVEERTHRLSETNTLLEREIAERQRAEELISASLAEKELLLREVHHRVKNNMQVISSLLNLQAGYVTDEEYSEMFRESQNRIKSMSLIIEKLFESKNLGNIDLELYVRALAKGLYRSYSADANRVQLITQIGDVSIGIDTAVPCGLIINELVSNSLKHAFPGGRGGEIIVSFRNADDEEYELSVSDDGVGMAQQEDMVNPRSLGLSLVKTIAEDQLHGRVEISSGKGTEVKVRFREVQYLRRF